MANNNEPGRYAKLGATALQRRPTAPAIQATLAPPPGLSPLAAFNASAALTPLPAPGAPATIAGGAEPSPHTGLRHVLGEIAWLRLPPAVRARFGEPVLPVDYVGNFDVVRASTLGRVIAWFCQAIGTPVVPRTGQNVPAVIHVGPVTRGASWLREYHWPNGGTCRVHSTKVISADGALTEELPAKLRMPLDVYEHQGVLHFVSKGYYFEFGHWKVRLPLWLSPGTTHVEHTDEANGWFRFTMTVTHPAFGEVFYQTGRFRAAGGRP